MSMPQWEYTIPECGPEHEKCPTAVLSEQFRGYSNYRQVTVRDGCILVTSHGDGSEHVSNLYIDLQAILCVVGMKLRADPEHLIEGGPEKWLNEHVGHKMWTVALDEGEWLAWKQHARKHRGATRTEAMAKLCLDEMMRSGQ